MSLWEIFWFVAGAVLLLDSLITRVNLIAATLAHAMPGEHDLGGSVLAMAGGIGILALVFLR